MNYTRAAVQLIVTLCYIFLSLMHWAENHAAKNTSSSGDLKSDLMTDLTSFIHPVLGIGRMHIMSHTLYNLNAPVLLDCTYFYIHHPSRAFMWLDLILQKWAAVYFQRVNIQLLNQLHWTSGLSLCCHCTEDADTQNTTVCVLSMRLLCGYTLCTFGFYSTAFYIKAKLAGARVRAALL